MTGDDHLARFIGQDGAMAALGIEVVEVGQGWARTAMVVRTSSCDHRGLAARGQLFTLADAAIALASNSYGPVALLVHADAEWLAEVGPGVRLTATCEVVQRDEASSASFLSRIADDEGTVVGAVWGTTRTPRSGP